MPRAPFDPSKIDFSDLKDPAVWDLNQPGVHVVVVSNFLSPEEQAESAQRQLANILHDAAMPGACSVTNGRRGRGVKKLAGAFRRK